MLRNYSSTAAATSLTSDITAAQTTIAVGSTTGYPAVPFTLSINQQYPDRAEIVEVTAIGGQTLTVTRAVDGTTARAHSAGASVVHTVSARDFAELYAHVGRGNFARRFLFGGS